jgi:hypothetical protein
VPFQIEGVAEDESLVQPVDDPELALAVRECFDVRAVVATVSPGIVRFEPESTVPPLPVHMAYHSS